MTSSIAPLFIRVPFAVWSEQPACQWKHCLPFPGLAHQTLPRASSVLYFSAAMEATCWEWSHQKTKGAWSLSHSLGKNSLTCTALGCEWKTNFIMVSQRFRDVYHKWLAQHSMGRIRQNVHGSANWQVFPEGLLCTSPVRWGMCSLSVCIQAGHTVPCAARTFLQLFHSLC